MGAVDSDGVTDEPVGTVENRSAVAGSRTDSSLAQCGSFQRWIRSDG
jgi:hypothetical protein